MKKVIVVGFNYMDLKISSNNRNNYLPQFLRDNGYDVELIVSNFNHHRKEHVKESEERNYKCTILPEIGYKKNVSIKRIFSIRSYVKSLKKYLKTKEPVDYVISFVPDHGVAQAAAKYAKRVGAKFIIDVRDVWPETFIIALKSKLLYNLVCWPLVLKANKTYKIADEVVAVSETYLKRALSVNKKVKEGHVIYLGTSFSEFDSFAKKAEEIHKEENEIWLMYTGTIGNSYDLDSLFRAYRLILDEGYTNVKLHVLGNGPLEEKYHKLDKELNTKIIFYGRRPYSEMAAYLKKADIVINPLVKGAGQSIINKHADYAASGVPVVSTQTTQEYIDLLSKYNAGLTAKNEDVNDLKDKIIYLIDNPQIRLEMGKNHRRMGEELFDRDKIYDEFLYILK